MGDAAWLGGGPLTPATDEIGLGAAGAAPALAPADEDAVTAELDTPLLAPPPPPLLGLALAEADALALDDADGLGAADPEGLGLADADELGLADADELGLTEPDGLGEGHEFPLHPPFLAPPVVIPAPPLVLPPLSPGPVVPPVVCARAGDAATSVNKAVSRAATIFALHPKGLTTPIR